MKILLVTARYPWPAWRGDQLRASQFVRMLAPHHDVTVLTPAPTPVQSEATPTSLPVEIEHYQEAPGALLRGGLRALWRSYPLQTAFHHQPDLDRRVVELAPRFDRVILQLVRLVGAADALREASVEVPLIVDLIDSLSLNFERRARFDTPFLRPLWLTEARRVVKTEASIVERAAATVVVCERDQRHLETVTEQSGRVGVVRLVVDVGEPAPEARASNTGNGSKVVLTGNLGYFVNQEAVAWFVRNVWPEFRRRAGTEAPVLQLAGARPSRLVRRLSRSPGVELISQPEDLRAIVRDGIVSVAPMRAGSGVPVKVLEAWAESTAVLASEWAAKGTDATAGTELQVASTEDPRAWVENLLQLTRDPDLRQSLGENGRRLLRQRHAMPVVERELLEIVSKAGSEIEPRIDRLGLGLGET